MANQVSHYIFFCYQTSLMPKERETWHSRGVKQVRRRQQLVCRTEFDATVLIETEGVGVGPCRKESLDTSRRRLLTPHLSGLVSWHLLPFLLSAFVENTFLLFFFLTWKIKRRGVNDTSGESSCMPACDYQWPRHSHGRTSSSASVGLWMLNNSSWTFQILLAQLHHRHHHHNTHSLFCNPFPAGYSASLWLIFVDFLLLCAV